MIEIYIKKPIYGTFIGVNATLVDEAIKTGEQLVLRIPQGAAAVDAKEWRLKAKEVYKVFNFANRPMRMYQGYVPLEPETPKVESEKQQALF